MGLDFGIFVLILSTIFVVKVHYRLFSIQRNIASIFHLKIKKIIHSINNFLICPFILGTFSRFQLTF